MTAACTPDPADRLAYSIDEAARLVGIGPATGWRLVRAGAWPVFRIGSRTLITRDDLLAYIAGQREPVRRVRAVEGRP